MCISVCYLICPIICTIAILADVAMYICGEIGVIVISTCIGCATATNGYSTALLMFYIAWAQAISCSTVDTSILKEAWRSCFLWPGNPAITTLDDTQLSLQTVQLISAVQLDIYSWIHLIADIVLQFTCTQINPLQRLYLKHPLSHFYHTSLCSANDKQQMLPLSGIEGEPA